MKKCLLFKRNKEIYANMDYYLKNYKFKRNTSFIYLYITKEVILTKSLEISGIIHRSFHPDEKYNVFTKLPNNCFAVAHHLIPYSKSQSDISVLQFSPKNNTISILNRFIFEYVIDMSPISADGYIAILNRECLSIYDYISSQFIHSWPMNNIHLIYDSIYQLMSGNILTISVHNNRLNHKKKLDIWNISTGVITNTIHDNRNYRFYLKLQEIDIDTIYLSGHYNIGKHFSIIDLLSNKVISSSHRFYHPVYLTGAHPYFCRKRKKLFSGSQEGYIYEYDMIFIKDKVSFKLVCRYQVHSGCIQFFVCIKEDLFLTIGKMNDLRITNWKDKKIIARFPTQSLYDPYVIVLNN